MSIPNLPLRKGAFPSPHFQPVPGVTLLNWGGLGTKDPSWIPEGGLIWGQCSGLSLNKAVLCAVLPVTTMAPAFLCLSQIVSAPDFHFQPFLLWVPPLLGASGPRFSQRNVLLCIAAGSR